MKRSGSTTALITLTAALSACGGSSDAPAAPVQTRPKSVVETAGALPG